MAIGDIIVGVDVSYSKVSLLMGKVDNFNQIQIIVKTSKECRPYENNEINPNVLIPALEDVVREAEEESGLKIYSTYVSIPGDKTNIIHGEVTKSTNDKMSGVTIRDVIGTIIETTAIQVPENQVIIDIIPDKFRLDNNVVVKDPLNKKSESITLLSQVITSEKRYIENLKKIFDEAKLVIDTFASDAFVDRVFYLEGNELNENVLVLNVQENETEAGIFLGNSYVYSNTFKFGGNDITNNISYINGISYEEAEKLKQTYNLALKSYIENDNNIQLTTSMSNEQNIIKISNIVEIIEASIEDMFMKVNKEIKRTGLKDYVNGIILCGSGISSIMKSDVICKVVFNLPVKYATSKNLYAIEEEYYRLYGLLKYFSVKPYAKKVSSNVSMKTNENILNKVLNKVKEFFYS